MHYKTHHTAKRLNHRGVKISIQISHPCYFNPMHSYNIFSSIIAEKGLLIRFGYQILEKDAIDENAVKT